MINKLWNSRKVWTVIYLSGIVAAIMELNNLFAIITMLVTVEWLTRLYKKSQEIKRRIP